MDPKACLASVMSSMNDSDSATNKLNLGKGFNHVHSLKHVKSGFRNLLGKFMNKILSHTYILPAILIGRIQPTVKSTSGNKTVSHIYKPAMNSSLFWRCLSIYYYLIYKITLKSIIDGCYIEIYGLSWGYYSFKRLCFTSQQEVHRC